MRVLWLLIYRLLSALPVIVLVSIFVFLLLRLGTGNPAIILAGDAATPETIAAISRDLGLDKPLLNQYVIWVWQMLQGNFGVSIITRQPVLTMIADRAGPTLALSLTTIAFAIIVGVPLGTMAASRKGGLIDRAIMAVSVAGFSAPVFVTGYILIYVFAVRLQWFPVQGYTSIFESVTGFAQDIALPTLTLGLAYVALFARIARSSVLEVLSEDFIRTAYSKGLSEPVVLVKHALRNAAVPIVSVIGIGFALMIGGVVVTESVFNIPGLGRLVVESVLGRDYTIIQGVIVILAIIYVFVNLLIDLAYILLDPRIKY